MDYRERDKGQSGIETMMLYGIVLLVAGGLIIYVANTGVLTQRGCSEQKYGFSVLSPKDWGVSRGLDKVFISVENIGYEDLTLNSANASLFGLVNCSAETGDIILPAETLLLTLECQPLGALAEKFEAGACYTSETVISYSGVNGRLEASRGKFTGLVE